MAYGLFCKATLTLVSLAVLLDLQSNGAHALRCHHCGWDTCGAQEELVECNLERVNQVHANLQRLVNLTQYTDLPTLGEFACFELRLTNAHGNRSGTVKSCTLKSAGMCELTGWKSVKVVGCSTCNDRDFCNGFNTLEPAQVDKAAGFSFSMYRPSSAVPKIPKPRLWCTAVTVFLVVLFYRLPSNGV
uniref:Salivary secreted peptide n=1 Tax=Anopheles christyi TaxID=43041 RepID=A0A182JSF8_9DIPT